jgi:hypothetical protein
VKNDSAIKKLNSLHTGEVVGSIPTAPTRLKPIHQRFGDRLLPYPPTLRREQTVLSPTDLGENAGSLFARRSADHSANSGRYFVPNDASMVAGARHEISIRYDWHANQQRTGRHPLSFVRLRELERIFRSRYGFTLPNDDAGRDDLILAAHHIAHRNGEVVRQIVCWASLWAPPPVRFEDL